MDGFDSRELMEQLGQALNSAIDSSEAINELMKSITLDGFSVELSCEFALVIRTIGPTEDDKAFLRKLKISPDLDADQ